MDWNQITLSLISLVFGGGITWIVTFKSFKRKSSAEADIVVADVKTKEIDNVQEAITIWREMAVGLKDELKASNDDRSTLRDEIQEYRNERSAFLVEVEKLRKQIVKLTDINQKIFKALDKITPENLAETVEQLKKLNS